MVSMVSEDLSLKSLTPNVKTTLVTYYCCARDDNYQRAKCAIGSTLFPSRKHVKGFICYKYRYN